MAPQDVAFARLFEEKVGRPLRAGVLLKDHSNFRVGGPADFFFEAETTEDLIAALAAARECGLRTRVIGGGYNCLFDDAGYRGLIVKNLARGVSLEARSSGGNRVAAISGTPLIDLVEFCAANGLEGLEFLAGIPGSVGGAVCGNAGAFGRCLGDYLDEASLIAGDGSVRRETRGYFDFAYRHSRLKTSGEIVLETVFSLAPGDRAGIRARIDGNLSLRAVRHPDRNMAYAGSFFKNPIGPDGEKIPAGLLLDQVGAKEAAVGGAAVFHGHANFLYNRGGASSADILALARELKGRVRAKFGIELEEEVVFLRAEP
jgi:UDP-N-acetylmuramate dehydrogenase